MRTVRKSGSGFGLIEILVVVALIALMAAFLYPRLVGRGESGTAPTPQERAQGVAGISYISQINQAISMYRMDNDGQNPPNLPALQHYGVTGEMLVDPVTRQPLSYDPQTGVVGAPATPAAPGTPGGAALPRATGF